MIHSQEGQKADEQCKEPLCNTLHISYPRNMSKSNSIIAAPLREALFECFRSITRLVRPELCRQTILVGGAASIAHFSVLVIEDVDVVVPSSALTDIWEGISAGAPNFPSESERQNRVRCPATRHPGPSRPTRDRQRAHRSDSRDRTLL